jgi:hypothetical protein
MSTTTVEHGVAPGPGSPCAPSFIHPEVEDQVRSHVDEAANLYSSPSTWSRRPEATWTPPYLRLQLLGDLAVLRLEPPSIVDPHVSDHVRNHGGAK